MSSEEPSRAERLRQRRSGREEQSKPSESSEPSELDQPSEPSKPESGSVKEEQVGTYMYLPQSQKKEIERLYNVLKAEFEYEYDDEFEKNRAFYPLLVQYGLDGLEDLDAQTIKTYLDGL